MDFERHDAYAGILGTPNAPVATITHWALIVCSLEVFNEYLLLFFNSDSTTMPVRIGELKYLA
jgi:hypothetical protein